MNKKKRTVSDRNQNFVFDRYSYISHTYYLFFLYIKFIREGGHMQGNLRFRVLQNVVVCQFICSNMIGRSQSESSPPCQNFRV